MLIINMHIHIVVSNKRTTVQFCCCVTWRWTKKLKQIISDNAFILFKKNRGHLCSLNEKNKFHDDFGTGIWSRLQVGNQLKQTKWPGCVGFPALPGFCHLLCCCSRYSFSCEDETRFQIPKRRKIVCFSFSYVK